MDLPDLIEGRLIKRYKRFLADIRLPDGTEVTAHCPNTGSMKNCADPGSRVWIRDVQSVKRKLRYRWELVEVEGQYLACINTGLANHLVKESIQSGFIVPLSGYSDIQVERPYGDERSRIDLLLTKPGRPDCYVEVKNVTLLNGAGKGFFPDAVTARGRKHLRELMAVAKAGGRAVLFFNVAHTGIEQLAPAWDIDPEYAATLSEAVASGVEVMAYRSAISIDAIQVGEAIPFNLATADQAGYSVRKIRTA
ncbi:MAG: DNA/RNA nuclease SfsA [Sedimenticola sp.]|uniref:Sugar fermentation stimulation protein homolog n=1 Tax=Sedimenticola thiotaurini TaxID=1543721 RepID=A0A558CRJ7_9GAMM|nr:DNA/RNA nuclease SfsA [Sedimenticola sp.]TVT51381.1 MAG: DNA/RNA nuclease SfsA [Sedimenticola thiotaurini]MCW8920607.1 DNA/RNA nuclease SfsA [Sedimenticola sp.]MCW8946106.1 DNA/RNA nuclease SfsA [Sedimenticola sp.]MCW8948842.1 DNA/RNA nuclease SfsA [Sedimenticola sp.]